MERFPSSLLAFFILLLMFSTARGKIECNYCGIRKLCDLKYDPDSSERILCDKSCLKFEGYSITDNSRVVVRECGLTDQNRCDKNVQWFGAEGTICTCNDDNCNYGNNQKSQVWMILAASFAAILILRF